MDMRRHRPLMWITVPMGCFVEMQVRGTGLAYSTLDITTNNEGT